MNKSESIILFQQIIQKLEKLEKNQEELSEQLKQTGQTIVENQKIIWAKIKSFTSRQKNGLIQPISP